MDEKARQFAKEIQQTPTGRMLTENMEALTRLSQSPQAQELLRSMGEKGKQAAQKAADSLKSGDAAGLSEIIALFSQSEAGRSLLQSLKNITGR